MEEKDLKSKYSPIATTQRTLQSQNIHSIPPPTPVGLTVSGNNEIPHNLAIALPIGCSTAKFIIALLRDLFVILDIVAQHVSTAGCDDTYIDIRARPEVVGEPREMASQTSLIADSRWSGLSAENKIQ